MAKDKSKNSTEIVAADAGMDLERVENMAEEEFSLDKFERLNDPSQLVETLKQEHLDWAHDQGLIGEKLFVMKKAQVVRGLFYGEGPPVTLHNRERLNKKTGEMEAPVIKTWRIKHDSGNFIRILSNYQLDKEMPEIPIGSPVQVIHGGQKDTGNGQRVNDMLVQFRRADVIEQAAKARGVLEAHVTDRPSQYPAATEAKSA